MNIVKTVQQELLKLLQSVSGIVERRHTLPILANILFRKNAEQLEVISSDLEIQIKASGNMGGDAGSFSTTVGARKLIDILRALPSDQIVSLNAQNNRLVLQSGKSKFTLQTLPSEDFPLVQQSNKLGTAFSIPQKIFKGLLQQVSFAMALQDIRYYLNGIFLIVDGKKLSLVATDGHRLVYSSSDIGTSVDKQEVIVPRKAVLELQKLLSDDDEDIEIQFSNNQARFCFNGIEFVTKLVEGKFPDYNKVIPKDQKNKVAVGRLTLLSSLQRSAILTGEKFKGVKLIFDKNLIRILANNSEQEESMEELDVDYTGDTIDIGFNVTYLIDALSNMSQEMVCISLSDANSSALFTIPENETYRYVVMPMRI